MKFVDADYLGILFHSAVWEIFFRRLGFLYRCRPDKWDCQIHRSADRGTCDPAFGPSCALTTCSTNLPIDVQQFDIDQ